MEKFFQNFSVVSKNSSSTQNCLLLVIEKWKNAVDNGKVFVAQRTSLTKATDCTYLDLRIEKLNAYGLSVFCLYFACARETRKLTNVENYHVILK